MTPLTQEQIDVLEAVTNDVLSRGANTAMFADTVAACYLSYKILEKENIQLKADLWMVCDFADVDSMPKCLTSEKVRAIQERVLNQGDKQ